MLIGAAPRSEVVAAKPGLDKLDVFEKVRPPRPIMHLRLPRGFPEEVHL